MIITYFDCPVCKGVMSQQQCMACYARSVQPAYQPPPLTEDDIRRVVREELHTAELARKRRRRFLG